MLIKELQEIKTATVSSEVAAALLDYENKNKLSDLVRLNNLPKTDYNTYPLLEIVLWKYAYIKSLYEKQLAEKSRDRLTRAQAIRVEMENEEKARQLIPVQEIEAAYINQAQIFTKGLEALQATLLPLVDPTTFAEVDRIIKTIRTQIAELPADIPADAVTIQP